MFKGNVKAAPLAVIAIVIALTFSLAGCKSPQTVDSIQSSESPYSDSIQQIPTEIPEDATKPVPNATGDAPTKPAVNEDASHGESYDATEWSFDAYPDYVRVDGNAIIAEELEPGQVVYSDIDNLGRTGSVKACVTYQMRESGSARERSDISDIEPSGWYGNAECNIELANGKTYHGYFYNRSHLLAKSLGGDDARYNLVTGTRMQNVGANDGKGGMAYTETLARDWLDSHRDGTVYYAATPVYIGDELVPRSVYVDIRTSDGSIDQHVEVFNTAYGYEIDYATGKWSPVVG